MTTGLSNVTGSPARGRITILDLEKVTCTCYSMIQREYERL
jgi:hypothetical protein